MTSDAATGRYHHGDLKNALLDAAETLLEEAGLQGFTLRACARLAGVSHAAPKHHFGDVKGLLAGVAERGYERLVSRLQAAIHPVLGDLDAEMAATTTAYVAFAEDFPEHFRVMFRADLMDFNAVAPPPVMFETFTELTNVVLRQRGEPEVSRETLDIGSSPALVNDILLGWCFIHGYAHLKLEGRLMMAEPESHDEHIRLASARLGALIRGLQGR